jgi:hypothetical protein
MEFVPYDASLGTNIGQRPTASVPKANFGEVIDSAFFMENDIANLARFAVKPAFTDDPEFNILEALEDNPFAMDRPEQMGRATSQAELDYITQTIQAENRAREVTAAAGFGGFLAAGLAGIVSPTSFVPLAGPAKGLKGAAQAFALAGGAVTAQEATLYGLQETRTGGEVFAGIAIGTVLGGLLGTAGRYLAPAERVQLEQGMASQRGPMTISQLDEATGEIVETRFNTIRDVEVPAMTVAAKAGDEVTVYRPTGEAVSAKILPATSAGVRKLSLSDGTVAQLGRDVFDTSPVSTKALIEVDGARVAVADLSDEQLTTALARNADEMLTERVNAATHEQKILESEVARRNGETVEPEVLATKQEADASAYSERGDGTASTVGAKQRATTSDRLARPGPIRGAAIGVLAKLNPLTRLIDSNFPQARAWASKIQMPGIRTANSVTTGPSAGAGTAYARSQVHGAEMVKFVQAYDAAYVRHIYGEKAPKGPVSHALMAQLQGNLRTPEGKMTFTEFGEAVFDVGNTAVRNPDEYVNTAAKAMDEYFNYMDKVNDSYYKQRQMEDGEDATPLYTRQEFAEDSDIQNYVHHIYDSVQVENKMDEFVNDMRAHGEELMDGDFRVSWAAYEKTRLKEAQDFSDLSLNAKQFGNLTKELERRVAEVDKNFRSELANVVDYRKSLRDAGIKGNELTAAVKAFREDLGPSFAQALKDRASDAKRLKDLTARRAETWDSNAKLRKEKQAKLAEEYYTDRVAKNNAFEDQWMAKGADDLDVDLGNANFARQSLEDAQSLFLRISGNPNRAVGVDVIGAQRGAQLQRMLTLPYDLKKKYLNRQPESVIRAHNYSMAPDLELYRISGSPNGARIFDDMKREFMDMQEALVNSTTEAEYSFRMGITKRLDANAREQIPLTAARREKLNAAQTKDYKAAVRDMEVIITRMRKQRGVPDDANALGYRLGRAAQNLNVTRYMGTVLPSSLPDIARPVMRYGLTSVFKNAWSPLVTDMKKVKMSRAEAYRFNIGTDPITHNRAQALFDVGENHSTRQTMAERGLEVLANKTGAVALFDRWTAANQHLATNVVFAEFSNALQVIAKGTPGPELLKARTMMNRLSLDDQMVARINRQFDREGGSTLFDDGFRLPNTEAWDDFETVMAMRAAVQQEATDLIVTPGLDRPSWMDENAAYKVVAQFRSFTYTSTNRVLMSGLQDTDMAYLNGVMMSLALGGISYYTWGMTAGGTSQERMLEAGIEGFAYEALQRSGLLGVLSEGTRIGEQIPALNDYAIFGGEGRNSRRASSVLGAALGPSYDLAERLVSIAQGLDEPTQSTLHAARVSMVPYQNVFYLRRLLDKVEEGLASNLPETRGQ